MKNLPLNTDFYLSFEKAGWEKLLVPMNVSQAVVGNDCRTRYTAGMVTSQLAKLLFLTTGQKQVPGTSVVVGDVSDVKLFPVSGVGVTLSPSKGNGPFFLKPDGSLNTKPETSTAGIALWINVPAGSYQVSFKHSKLKCAPQPFTSKNAGKTATKVVIPSKAGPWIVLAPGLCQ